MSDVVIFQRFRVKRETAAAFTAANTLLLEGEWALELDTGKLKMGDGVTAWNSLAYVSAVNFPFDPTDSGMSATNVQTAIDELAAQKLGDAPSDGAIYGRKNGAWVATAASGEMQLLGTATVSGAAATDLTLSGLDLSAFAGFKIILKIKNATASAGLISLFYNGDTTATNYDRQALSGTGSSAAAARVNAAAITSLIASECSTGTIDIFNDFDGKPRARSQTNIGAPSGLILQDIAHVWDSATNVTSITLSSSVANALAIGSTFSVYGIAP
jgi:hypothetical protein